MVILNTDVDDGAADLTCLGFWDETIFKLNKRYPGIHDESTMDRYLGIGFYLSPITGALTASMLHAVLKILATCCTDFLPAK